MCMHVCMCVRMCVYVFVHAYVHACMLEFTCGVVFAAVSGSDESSDVRETLPVNTE